MRRDWPSLTASLRQVDFSLEVPAGTLKLSVKEFTAKDLLVQHIYGSLGEHNLYRQRVSWERERRNIIFARDERESVTIEFADVDDKPELGRLSIWHDNLAPTVHTINHRKLEEVRDFNEALVEGDPIDVLGKRRPPALKATDLYKAARDLPDFQAFTRGNKTAAFLDLIPPGEPMPAHHWACWAVCAVPACGVVCLFWVLDNPSFAAPS